MSFPENLLGGTSSWSSSAWVGPFYPPHLRPGDRLVEDKAAEMTMWTKELKKIVTKGVKSYAFFNNHYAGFAPRVNVGAGPRACPVSGDHRGSPRQIFGKRNHSRDLT